MVKRKKKKRNVVQKSQPQAKHPTHSFTNGFVNECVEPGAAARQKYLFVVLHLDDNRKKHNTTVLNYLKHIGDMLRTHSLLKVGTILLF